MIGLRGEAIPSSNLGFLFMQRGEHSKARKHLERQLQVSREIGFLRSEAIAIGTKATDPYPIRIVTPEYPAEARRSRKEGRVMVRVLVDKAGNVEKVEILQGPEIFRKVAETAAWQFRFRPGKHEGERRKVWMIMPIEFLLK